jgi:hypothetical protein
MNLALPVTHSIRCEIFDPPQVQVLSSIIYRFTTYSPNPALWYYQHGISQCLGGHA